MLFPRREDDWCLSAKWSCLKLYVHVTLNRLNRLHLEVYMCIYDIYTYIYSLSLSLVKQSSEPFHIHTCTDKCTRACTDTHTVKVLSPPCMKSGRKPFGCCFFFFFLVTDGFFSGWEISQLLLSVTDDVLQELLVTKSPPTHQDKYSSI